MGKLKTAWTAKAKTQLKQIYDYLKTPQVAANVKADLIQASKGVTYAEQYQKDDINPNYRRIVVRHYKLIYKEEKGKIIILRIFDTLRNPERLMAENE